MKTLILNGSPRHNGDTLSMIAQLKKHLDGEIKIVNTYYDKISACLDCRYCWKHDGCSQKDDMQGIYDYLKDCDNVIIASPVYFSELTGPLLSVASRLQTFYATRRFRKQNPMLKKKFGAILLSGGGDGEPNKAESTAKCLLKHMNAEYIGHVYSLHTDSLPSKDDRVAIQEIYNLAVKLNSLDRTTSIGK